MTTHNIQNTSVSTVELSIWVKIMVKIRVI